MTAFKPNLTAFLVCESVIKDEKTGNATIVGVFDRILAPAFPATHPKLVVFTQWLGEFEDAIFKQTIKIVSPNREEIASINDAEIKFGSKANRAIGVFQFSNLRFEKGGVCKIQLIFDGKLEKELPIKIETGQ